jgi:cytochrome c oxidase subunit 1
MPRRYADYLPTDGFTLGNMISTVGSFILALSTIVFLWNVVSSLLTGEPAGADDPWGYANSLEWATSSPPPRHNFLKLPRIRSERPAFDLHYGKALADARRHEPQDLTQGTGLEDRTIGAAPDPGPGEARQRID